MMDLKRHIPYGVQDYLPQECYNKRLMEQRLLDCFGAAGYRQVQTPTFEHYEVFTGGIGEVKQEKLIKLFAGDGRILVLRPDMTMPIARMAATKLAKFPARLCYTGQAFGCENAYYADQREFTQAGVELLGIPGEQADAEVIALAIEGLKTAGLAEFIIDMGQVEFFKGLAEEAGLTPEQSEQLREYVDQKNDLAVELFMKKHELSRGMREKIAQLPTLYGGEEVFEEAYRFTTSQRCRNAVENLSRIYNLLKDFGYAQYISVDLGMLQSIDYYSGCIFKGISRELGSSLLSGGRYDSLLGELGKPMPATGFALGIKRTMIAIERQGELKPLPPVQYVLSCATGCRGKAYAALQELRREHIAISAFDLDEEALRQYAAQIGAQAVYIGSED